METGRSKIIPKIMLSYAFTFMMIELADSASLLIDGIIISNFLGSTALAVTGLGNTSFQMISLFCGIFAVGIQSACSAKMGAGDTRKTSQLFSGGCIVVAIIAAVITVLGFMCLDPICLLLGADGSDKVLYDGLREYLRGWFVGIPGFIAFTVLSPIVTLDGNKKCVTAATVIQSVLNLSFDYLAATVFHSGTWGFGFATGFGFDIAALVLISNFFRKRSSFRFSFVFLKASELFDMMRTGLPRLTKYGCKILAPLLINRTVLAVGGSAAMAAISVKSSIGNFCLVVGSGIAESVNLMSQVYFSEKDKAALRETAKSALKYNIILGSVFAAVIFAFAEPLANIYLRAGTPENEMAATMLRMLAFSIALYGINCCVLNYLQGTRKILPAHMQTASHRLVFLALCTFVLGKIFGINGLFVAIPLSELLVLVTYVLAALINGRGKNRIDALMLLPDSFGYSEDESLSFSLTTMEEAIGISERVESFCKTHGIDKRRSYFAALCIEELAGNVIGHGFKKDNKSHSCDIRVMIEGEDVILRIRDDCRYFNMKERYELMKAKGNTSNIGIRLVYGIAKEINYVNLLNTNTLIIRV